MNRDLYLQAGLITETPPTEFTRPYTIPGWYEDVSGFLYQVLEHEEQIYIAGTGYTRTCRAALDAWERVWKTPEAVDDPERDAWVLGYCRPRGSTTPASDVTP